MNKVILVGRLTKDPENRTSGDTTVTRFSVAVNRNFKNANGEYEADFPNCIAFGKTAEFVEKYFKKGDAIGITGRLQTGSYTNKNGDKVYTTDVVIDTVEFVGGGKSSVGDNTKASAKVVPNSKKREEPEYEESDDDEYPFS